MKVKRKKDRCLYISRFKKKLYIYQHISFFQLSFLYMHSVGSY